jgi:hypothetical protein
VSCGLRRGQGTGSQEGMTVSHPALASFPVLHTCLPLPRELFRARRHGTLPGTSDEEMEVSASFLVFQSLPRTPHFACWTLVCIPDPRRQVATTGKKGCHQWLQDSYLWDSAGHLGHFLSP